MDPDPTLAAVYRATDYIAIVGGIRFTLHIGDTNAELDRFLADRRLRTWAFVTAYNPGSIRTAIDVNEAQQQRLRELVRDAGYSFHEGAGVGIGWPAENSLLILGISEADAVVLARRFGQCAFVAGDIGQPARLVWTMAAGADGAGRERL